MREYVGTLRGPFGRFAGWLFLRALGVRFEELGRGWRMRHPRRLDGMVARAVDKVQREAEQDGRACTVTRGDGYARVQVVGRDGESRISEFIRR